MGRMEIDIFLFSKYLARIQNLILFSIILIIYIYTWKHIFKDFSPLLLDFKG